MIIKINNKLDEYVEQEKMNIEELNKILEELNKKIFKFGFESEIKLINFIIPKKEKMLNEIIEFKKELARFKG